MGKSTAAGLFARRNIPVYAADTCVHNLLRPGGRAEAIIRRIFPESVYQGRIDRQKLGKIVFADSTALAQLEEILHPLIWQEIYDFLWIVSRRRCRFVLLDIPLLLEKNSVALVDLIIVVSAPERIQTARVLRRPGLDLVRLASIRLRQMPNSEKCRHADHVLFTGLGKRVTLRSIYRLLQHKKHKSQRWRPGYIKRKQASLTYSNTYT